MAIEALDRVGLADAQAHAIAGEPHDQAASADGARARAGAAPTTIVARRNTRRTSHDALDDILSVLRQVNRDGVTIVIIEHTMHAMVKLVDEFSVLDHGRLIAAGPPSRW